MLRTRLTFVFASVFIVYVCLEVTLLVLRIPREYQPHSAPVQFQESVGTDVAYTNLRSASIDFEYDGNPRGYFREDNIVQHVTNAAGVRGPEISLEVPDATVRVAFLGDSITFGEGVYFEDTYPERFKVLAQEAGLFQGKSIDAINLGIGGYNTEQEMILLKQIVSAGVRPDYVVVGYNMNDANEALIRFEGENMVRTPSQLETYITKMRKDPAIFQASQSLRLIRHWFVNKSITNKTLEYYHDLYAEDSTSWQISQQALTGFSEFSQDTGIPVVFVIFPRLFQLDQYPFKLERERVREALEIRDLDSIFLYPYLQNYKGPELWVHPTDSHPNEIVHNIAAEALVHRFKKLEEFYATNQ
jgi:lysophospholipase L1-like esterase